MIYRNEPSADEPSADEMEAAALAGMADADKRTWKALKARQRKRKWGRRAKHGPDEDRMVKGPVEDRGRKRGRRK